MITLNLKEILARPARMDDLETTVDLFNAYSRSLIGVNQYTVDDIRSEWQTPNFDLNQDTRLVWTSDGKPIGYAEFWDLGEPHVRLIGWVVVHPEHQSQGIGSYLLEWVTDRARQNIAKAPSEARVVLHQSVLDTNERANDLLQKHGFNQIRNFYRMQIDFTTEPEAPVVPEGIQIRSIARGEERMAVQAAYEAFMDHWGSFEQPFEEYFERWQHYLENDKDYDPHFYFVAMDGDEVAGMSLCYPKTTEDPDMGWIGTLGVLRPWRKRGLGSALLQHSFRAFFEHGKLRAGLGVDAASLTGATQLYERAGMYVERKTNVYELELRAGEDLLTQTIKVKFNRAGSLLTEGPARQTGERSRMDCI